MPSPIRESASLPEASLLAAIERGALLWAETGDPALARAADALAMWLARVWTPGDDDALTIEAALGLDRACLNRARHARRDTLLREVAQRHWPALKGRALARQVTQAVARYEAAGWPRHRRAGRPDGRDGDLFDLLRLGPVPRGSRLRDILGG